MLTEKEYQVAPVTVHLESRSNTGAFVTIALLIAFLFVANLYTLSKLNSTRQEARKTNEALGNELKEIKSQYDDLLLRNSVLTSVQSNRVKELQGELDRIASLIGQSQNHMLSSTQSIVTSFKKQQNQLKGGLEGKLSLKADTEDLTTLAEDVSMAQADLGSTERTVDVLAKDLSVARSELGNLIAKTYSELQALSQSNDRDYHGFTLEKNRMLPIGGISLILKKTDVQQQNFSVNVIANDQEIRNKSRNVYEPLYFYVGQTRVPYELVVTSVDTDNVTGYIGIPKAALVIEQERSFRPRT